MLGFRADPKERLRPLLTELQTLHQAYTEKPVFGVEMNWGTEVWILKERSNLKIQVVRFLTAVLIMGSSAGCRFIDHVMFVDPETCQFLA